MDKTAILKGKKLADYVSEEIAQIDIQNLIDLEEQIIKKQEREEEEKQLRLFRNKEYIARELRNYRIKAHIEAAKKIQTNVSEIEEKIKTEHQNKMLTKKKIVGVVKFKKEFEARILEEREEKLQDSLVEFGEKLKERFGDLIFKRCLDYFEEERKKKVERDKEEEERKVRNERLGIDNDSSKVPAGKLERNTTMRRGENEDGTAAVVAPSGLQRNTERRRTAEDEEP